ncbi:hypothetical protein H4R99_005788 [Coemansia sp. RSA 1722]|nr:hypothetical protein LPJ57_002367 [Coemansia sp. RSA 486]KAJ2228745.1 hypothetical protein IWW45_006480 [Coemansia sp. RSA 485]KAJ2594397.1 hypothetical protein H4R99_005788 [Coemansia sp. RSA 1722]KAJ2635651.1 hypothetical protein GGF40_003481 [Coemansia sp. RSA 1286]
MLFYTIVLLVVPLLALADVSERVFVQQLDHFSTNASSTAFAQKYLIADQYYRPGGPWILYSVGERAADPEDLSDDGWVMQMARETSGRAVLLEQRFYGKSTPTAGYEYLTVEQMMADIRRFVQHMDDASSSWVFVGASFAGSLMAWTKHRYPELPAFVLASSAPMRLTDAYWQFDMVVEERLPCARKVSAAVRAVDRVLDKGQLGSMNTQLALPANASVEVLASVFSLQTAWMVQQPADLRAASQIGDFCQRLRGNSDAELVREFAAASREFIDEYQMTLSSGCPIKGDDVSWMWQQCTQLGLWQTAPPDDSPWFARRLRSRRLTPEYFAARCHRCFPQSNAVLRRKSGFRRFANDALVTFESATQPTDVLFTSGSLDPWKHTFVMGPLAVAIEGMSHAEDLLCGMDDCAAPGIYRAHRAVKAVFGRWMDMQKRGDRALSRQAASSGLRRWKALLAVPLYEAALCCLLLAAVLVFFRLGGASVRG